MISKVKELKLISIYLYICDIYKSKLKNVCERFSNNNHPDFTDQEVMTIYLYIMNIEQRLKIKQIHEFASEYLHSWFPLLPTYEAFIMRLNRLSEAFRILTDTLLSEYCPDDCDLNTSIMDSLPIITCSGKRFPSVARELTDKGFCSTKSMYYYGLKLHALAFHRPCRLPFPESIVVTSASENDLNVHKQNWCDILDRNFYGDKIYNNKELWQGMEATFNSKIFTPVKAIKGQSNAIRQWNKAADDLYSRAVSKIRQPIESLFNWIIEKTDIQRASKVRSTKGLLVHVFGRIAASFIFLIFNS
ncbi:transposase [Bacteroidota bacterium]